MADRQDSLKTFDPEEATKIIEDFKKPETKYVQGFIGFSVVQNFVVLEMQTERELFRGDRSEHEPSGVFLVFPRHQFLQFVKEKFDLRDKPDKQGG